MWYFYSPSIIYGEDALDFLENIAGKKCFIVADKVIEELGYLKILTDKVTDFGKEFEIFTEVVPDPHEEDILKCAEKCNAYKPDLILALGGGSVMDTAKATWALYEYPESTIDDLHPFNMKFHDMGKKAKLIAIPTTSGTGAETTWAVVISRLEDNMWKKLEQAHKGFIPTYAILDPIFPVGMPPSLTRDTAFDALAHSFEGLASMWKNEFSDALSFKAIQLVFKWLPVVMQEPNNMEARDYMHQAATIAGLAFGNSQAHIGHSMGHSWGAVFHTPHGKAVGIFLPYISQFVVNNPDNDEAANLYGRIAKQLGWAKWEDDDKAAAQKVIKKIKDLAEEVGFPTSLKDLDIPKEKFEENLPDLVDLCFQSSSSVMSPRAPNKDEYGKLYRYAYEGKDIDF